MFTGKERERLAHELTLGEQAFMRALEDLAVRRADLIKDARVAVKRNSAGELVFAVIVPTSPPIGLH